MNRYLFTLFVRFFVGFSAFIIFILTSNIFGAEGRGFIGYGSSLASLIGVILSFNLGRSFLLQTKQNKLLGFKILPGYLAINYLLMIAAITAAFFYQIIIFQGSNFLNFYYIFAVLILVIYNLWLVNGSGIYATLNQTKKQDLIIICTRLTLIAFVGVIYFSHLTNIKTFFFFYATILGIGTLIEIAILGRPNFSMLIGMKNIKNISESNNMHLDYLVFNLFPFVLMQFAGSIFELSELGRLNFIFQLLSFVLIFPSVASIRIKSYVSSTGAIKNFNSIVKLFLFTLFASILLVFIIYLSLKTDLFLHYFPSFGDMSSYFLIATVALPGCIAYYFMYPVLIEYDQIALSMKINSFIFIIFVLLTYIILRFYHLAGAISLFALYYFFIFLAQLYFCRRLKFLLKKI